MAKSINSEIAIFFRSLIYFISFTIVLIFFSSLIGLSFLLPRVCRLRLVDIYFRFELYLLRLICHIDVKLEGQSHILKDRPCIIMSKHQSTFETFYLPILFNEPAIIAKQELLWLPFFSWGLLGTDPIVIDRGNKISAIKKICVKGKKCLASGRSVLIFPEGTRVPVGTVGHYHLGGAMLAVNSGAPIIPVAHNAGRFWKRRFIKRPGTIKMVIGPLIESKGRTSDEVLELTKSWIEQTMLEIDN